MIDFGGSLRVRYSSYSIIRNSKAPTLCHAEPASPSPEQQTRKGRDDGWPLAAGALLLGFIGLIGLIGLIGFRVYGGL